MNDTPLHCRCYNYDLRDSDNDALEQELYEYDSCVGIIAEGPDYKVNVFKHRGFVSLQLVL